MGLDELKLIGLINLSCLDPKIVKNYFNTNEF